MVWIHNNPMICKSSVVKSEIFGVTSGHPGGIPLPELLLDVLEIPGDEAEKEAHVGKLKELKQSLGLIFHEPKLHHRYNKGGC